MPLAVAAPSADWIGQTTSQLGDALGWPIAWRDAAGDGIDVDDGEQVVGRLHVEPPDDPRLQSAFQSAYEVGEVFARILSRLAVAHRKLQSHQRSVASLTEIGAAASHADALPAKLARLMRTAVHSAGLWSAAFYLLDPNTSQWRLRATYNLPAKLLPDCCPQPQRPMRFDRRRPDDAASLPEGCAVGVLAPVLLEGCPVGALWAFDRRQRMLGDWEIQVLQSVAVQIAAALERTVLIEESAQRRQLKSDLRIASRKWPVGLVQPLADDCGLDIGVRAASVIEVGGDLCDVIPLERRRTLIAIGDAVGHGIPAAMLVSVARGALRALVAQAREEEITTQSLMVGINRALFALTRSEQFVTLMLAVVDAQAGTLTYTNAGHPPPLLLSGGEWRSLTSHGLFLGVSPEVPYAATELSLNRGDVFVGFTDGVTETVNRSRQVFRRQGIRDTVPAEVDAAADALAETIWQRLASHDPDQPLRDDRTLLVMKYLGG